MPDRRPGWAGRLVEVDRRPPPLRPATARAAIGFDTEASRTTRAASPRVAIARVGAGHAGRDERDVPLVDLVQGLHGGRY